MSGEDPKGAPSCLMPSRLMPWAVAGSALLMIASGVLFYLASQTPPGPVAGAVQKVVVGDKTCDPNDITVPAGRTSFEIHNASNRILEWEILDGVMVLEERENIAPGFRATVTARLKPGRYQITCGLLSNPRGTLTVTASTESEAEREKPPLTAFIGPLSEYRVFLMLQAASLAKQVKQLGDAIQAGDLEAARKSYAAARLPYRRMDMVSGRFSDLKNSIDPLADYLTERESDPGFTGFHRIEYGLFSKNSVEGLQPVAEKLASDVETLTARIKALRLAPQDLASGVARQARILAEGQVLKGENRYGPGDLQEFSASFEGMEKSLDLLVPLGPGAGSDAAKALASTRADLHAELDALRLQGGERRYEELPVAAREQLARRFLALANAADTFSASLGLD